MKLKVCNFQSIKSAEIDLEGFVVITGESNLGKSALLRAVRGLALGVSGDHFVRQGESHAEVTLVDSSSVRWQKVHKDRRSPQLQTQLEIDSVVHEKYGVDHEPMMGPLGYRKIETAAGHRTPQFAFQHDQPFLIAETPTVVAEVFKMLGRVDVISKAQSMSKRDLRETDQTRKTRQEDHEAALELFAEMAGLGKLKGSFDDLITECDKATVAFDNMTTLLSGAERALSLRTEILKDPPDLPPLEDQIAQLGKVDRCRDLGVTSPVFAPPDLPDLIFLNSRLAQVERARELASPVPGSSSVPPVLHIPDTTLLEKIDTLLRIKIPDTGEVESKIEACEKALTQFRVCPVCEAPLENH